MNICMGPKSPDERSPKFNYEEEALLLEDESEARGGNEAEDGDELINHEINLEPQWLANPSSSSTWLYHDNKPDVIAGAGLENLGNTCFLNSMMQCFIHTVPLLHGIFLDNHSNCDRGKFCIVCALRELINLSLTWKNGSVAPWGLVNNLSYFSSGFQRFQQEDAHEFLQCFLDRLETCHDSSQSNNIVKQVFGGCLVSKLQCCNCGHCSDTYEPSIDLSLEIKDADNLLTALQSFTKVEKIEDPETKFTCEKCKEQVSVEKQLAFDKAPSVAVFQLKRFENDGWLVQKIDKHVAFPLDLDLLPFTAGDKKSNMELRYVLYAVVVHDGLTSTSGHYYCFIRLSPNIWCKFDDSRVVLVDEDFVLSQEAYLLFYAKEGTSWFSSFIETQKFSSVDSNIWNTSPKSVLDRINTSPDSCNLENKFRGVDNNDEIKDSKQHMVDKLEINGATDNLPRTSTLAAPPSSSPSPKAHKEGSPTLVEKVKRTEETSVVAKCQVDIPNCEPLRSPSPEIYREDPPGFTIPRGHLKMVERVACKRRLEKDMDDLETKQACSFIKKNMHGSRGQQMLEALKRSKTDASVNRNKSRKIGSR
ncbi:hypothetical protein CASFOL_000243 [Castilleja foliolosa]|uniref:Ubiquitin carboxyl-terminal hydrolase n=1 Tax=Castilleja foliolosa TaxID=1961234 RepID=A0ABD3EN53_9LAMI